MNHSAWNDSSLLNVGNPPVIKTIKKTSTMHLESLFFCIMPYLTQPQINNRETQVWLHYFSSAVLPTRKKCKFNKLVLEIFFMKFVCEMC